MSAVITKQPAKFFIFGDVTMTHGQRLQKVAQDCGAIWHNPDRAKRPKSQDHESFLRGCIDDCQLLLVHWTFWDTIDGGISDFGNLMYAVGRGIPVVLAVDPDVCPSVLGTLRRIEPVLKGRLFRFVSDDAVPHLLKAALHETGLARVMK